MGESRQHCRSIPMMRSSSLPPTLRVAITSHRLLKVIAGLTNVDAVAVLKIARAAAAGGADLVDIACEPALVRAVAEAAPQLPICVSAVDPELFPAAVAAGATMVEIGNLTRRCCPIIGLRLARARTSGGCARRLGREPSETHGNMAS